MVYFSTKIFFLYTRNHYICVFYICNKIVATQLFCTYATLKKQENV